MATDEKCRPGSKTEAADEDSGGTSLDIKIPETTEVQAIKSRPHPAPSDYKRMVRPRAEYRRGQRRGPNGIIEVVHGPRSAFFYGTPHAILAAVAEVGCPHQWTLHRDGIAVPIQHAGEVDAHLCAEGYTLLDRLVG